MTRQRAKTLDEILEDPAADLPIDPEVLDVYAFHEQLRLMRHTVPGLLPRRWQVERHRHLAEEVQELYHALENGDLVAAFDALLDIVWLAKGTGVMMGLPWAEGWSALVRANAARERGPGTKLVVKPPGWVGPEAALRDAIEAHGTSAPEGLAWPVNEDNTDAE
jgi:hypothetical protein